MAKPLALTSGEPAGIGPDITIKAWLRRNELKLPAFYLRGDPDLLRHRAKAIGLELRLAEVRAEEACDAFADALPVVVTGDRRGRDLGFPTANLVPPDGVVCPGHGVYACLANGLPRRSRSACARRSAPVARS